jgi:hypothetical protein
MLPNQPCFDVGGKLVCGKCSAKPKEPETWVCWLCGVEQNGPVEYRMQLSSATCRECYKGANDPSYRGVIYAGMFKSGWPKDEPASDGAWICYLCERPQTRHATSVSNGLNLGNRWCMNCAHDLEYLKKNDQRLEPGIFKGNATMQVVWDGIRSCYAKDARIRSLEQEVEHQRSLNVVHKGWIMDVAKALAMPTEALIYADVVECAAKQRAELERIRDKCEEAHDATLDYRMAISAIKTVLANLHEEPRT